jgi:hypothetical protein
VSDLPRNLGDDVLDDTLADFLLDGLAPAGAPGGYATVAIVLGQLRAPATASELAGEQIALARFRAQRDGGAVVTPISAARSHRASATQPPATRSSHRTRRTLAVSLVAAAVLALGGTAWAASGGVLPGPVQDLAHDALDVVGVHVPGGDGDVTGTTGGAGDQGTSRGAGTRGAGDGKAGVDGRGPAPVTSGPGTTTTPGGSGGNGGNGGNGGPDGTPSGGVGAGANNPNAGGTPSGNPNAGEGNSSAGGNGNGNAGGNDPNAGQGSGNANPNAGGNNPNAGQGNTNTDPEAGGNGNGNGA